MSDLTRMHVNHVLSWYYGALTQSAIDDILNKLFPAEPGPRTWSIPAKPEGVAHFLDKDGDLLDISSSSQDEWVDLLVQFGPLTEVVESEVEAAARRLREDDAWHDDRLSAERAIDDIRTVLVHVLSGGTL